MLTIKLYEDPAITEVSDASDAQMTCQVGTMHLQNRINRNDTFTVECLIPTYPNLITPFQLFTEIEVLEIVPSHAFIDDTNITVYVDVSPLYNISTLACKFQSAVVPGEYFLTDEGVA